MSTDENGMYLYLHNIMYRCGLNENRFRLLYNVLNRPHLEDFIMNVTFGYTDDINNVSVISVQKLYKEICRGKNPIRDTCRFIKILAYYDLINLENYGSK